MNIVKFYRTISFLTQDEMSALTGIEQYRLSRIEAGKTQATEGELRALAKVFGVTVRELNGEPCVNAVEQYLRMRGAVGHMHGISEDKILADLGVSERRLRKMVQTERMGGALICHDYDECGYYIAATTEEKQRFLKRHMNTIRTLSRECKAFRDDLKANGEMPCA